jgi:hypothetical protein
MYFVFSHEAARFLPEAARFPPERGVFWRERGDSTWKSRFRIEAHGKGVSLEKWRFSGEAACFFKLKS